MRKPKLSEQEIKEKEAEKKINSCLKKLATRVKNQCKDGNMMAMKLQAEFLKNNNAVLPYKELDKHQTVYAFNQGIEKYKEELRYR